MNDAEYLVKTLPKWLEIDKSTPNKPAVVLSQKFGFSRNIKKYPFLETTTMLEKDAIFADVEKAVKKTKVFTKENLVEINLKNGGYLTESFLFEKDIIPQRIMSKDCSRGIFADGGGNLPTILVNTKNHLDITANCPFGKETDALAKLNEIDNILGEELLYAYDSRLGFLMSSPEECGSGFFTEMITHLPGLVLTEEINEVLNGISIMGARIEGVFNESSEAWGSFFRVTANFSSIENEDELIKKNKEIQTALTTAESKARKRLFKEAGLVMEDKIFRSFAMMKYSRIMPVSQLFNFISLLRLGSEQKIFPMNMKILNMIFERGFTGNILVSLKDNSSFDIDEERAAMYRALLEDVNII